MSEDVTIILAGLDGKPHDPMCSMNHSHWRTDYNWNHSDNQFCMLCPIIEAVRKDERQRVLDAAREAVVGQIAPRIRAAAQLWSCDPDDCPLCDCNLNDEGREHIGTIAASEERDALAAIDALRGME